MKKALAIILTIVAALSSVTLISNAKKSDTCDVGMNACNKKLGDVLAFSFDEYKNPKDFYNNASDFYRSCLNIFCSKEDFKDNLLLTKIFENPYSFIKLVKENVDKAVEYKTTQDNETTMANQLADAYNITYPAGIHALV